MLRQKSWDQYEIALLIECYVNVTSQGKELEVELIELSENLRSMAVHVDDIAKAIVDIIKR